MLKDNPTAKEVFKEIFDRIVAEKVTTKEEQDFICYQVSEEAVKKGFDVEKGLEEIQRVSKNVEKILETGVSLDEFFAKREGDSNG
jgi:hypothetical protein